MTSNVKRLHNEIISLEENSDSRISYNKYYIIRITVSHHQSVDNGEDKDNRPQYEGPGRRIPHAWWAINSQSL